MTNEFGAKIRSLRAGAGLTQEQLAQKLSVTPQAVSKWERSESSPDTDNLGGAGDVHRRAVFHDG